MLTEWGWGSRPVSATLLVVDDIAKIGESHADLETHLGRF